MTVRALIGLLAFVLAGCADGPAAEGPRQCTPAPEAAPAPLNACGGGARVTVASVGDVLLHAALQRRGYAEGFDAIWGRAAPWLESADIVTANLEGPAAAGVARGGRPADDPGPVFDGVVYSGYPQFNYHPSAIDALRALGVDLVSTANNHALDRGTRGVDATLAALAARGMAHTGTIARGAPRDFATRLDTPLGPVAFIACSYDTNGIADPGRQVLLCHRDRAELLALVRAEAARGAVIVLPHWGVEYSHRPTSRQRALARDLAGAGATAVIGAHPHVVQPWETVEGAAGVQVPVIHSLGNFVSAQGALARRTGIIVRVELCRGSRGRPVAAGAGWVPVMMLWTPRGPELYRPRPGADAGPGAARALVERLIPGRDLSVAAQCRPDGQGG